MRNNLKTVLEDDNYDISDADDHFNLFCKNIDPSLKRLLGIEDNESKTEEKTDWKPPKTHGLNNSEPIIPRKKVYKAEDKTEYKLENKIEDKIEYKLEINKTTNNESSFIKFCRKLNPSLRKLIGINYEECKNEEKCDWKPPNFHGLKNSERILPPEYFENKSTLHDIDILYDLENDIRNLRVLSNTQIKLIQSLPKEHIMYLIKIYNECYYNLLYKDLI